MIFDRPLAEWRRALAQSKGRGVRIALLDSGVEQAHPDLHGLRLADDWAWEEENNRPGRAVPGGGVDAFGHGTALAALIQAGVPAAQLGSFRVLSPHLRGKAPVIAHAAHAAIEKGYNILHCSFGCGVAGLVLAYKAWVDAALLAGVHVVAAAGFADSGQAEWPAHFAPVIAVRGAAGPPAPRLAHVPGSLAGFAAFGGPLSVPWNQASRKTVTGASFAAAQATICLARLLASCPELTPLEAKAALTRLAQTQ